MKKMKVVLVSILAFGMLVGCGNKSLTEDEMKALLTEAQAKMTEVDSANLGIKGNLKLSGDAFEASGMTETDVTLDMQAKYKDMKSSQMQLAGNLKVGALGMDISGELYIKDSAMYVNFLGSKMKMPLDLSSVDMIETAISPEDLSMLSNWSYEKKDGMDYISCELSSDFFETVLEEAAEEGIAYKEATVKYRFGINKDQYISKIEMEIGLGMEAEGQTMQCSGTILMDMSEHNQVSEIDFPDLSGYLEETFDAEGL